MKIEYCQKCDRGIKSGEEKTYIKDGQILCEECYLRAAKQEHERAASEKVHGKSQDEIEATSLKKQRKSKKNKDRETAIAIAIGVTLVAILVLLMISEYPSYNETVERRDRTTQSRAKTEYAKARTEEERKVSDVGGVVRGLFIRGMPDEDVIRLVEKTLTEGGLLDVTARVADGRRTGGVKCLIVSFRSRALPQRESAPKEVFLELSSILGAYIGARREGWDVDELTVVVGDSTGMPAGIFYCEKEWADDVAKEPTVESLGLLSLRVFKTFTREKIYTKPVDLFPIENLEFMRQYGQETNQYSAIIGTVRNNANYPVRGRIIARFLSSNGTVFHVASVWVVDLVYTHAVGTDDFPITPSWIEPGSGGFFILIDEAIVFRGAAWVEVAFEKL